MRVSSYVGITKTEVHFLQAQYLCKTSHGCFCAYCMEFKFSQCEHIAITRGNKRSIKMKKVAAEGANRDASFVGKLFRFYQVGGQPTVQSAKFTFKAS